MPLAEPFGEQLTHMGPHEGVAIRPVDTRAIAVDAPVDAQLQRGPLSDDLGESRHEQPARVEEGRRV